MQPHIEINAWNEATITLEFPGMPVLVKGGAEANVFRKEFTVDLGGQFKIDKIRTFIATDRGDIGEFDIEVFSDGLSVYRESFHKEQSVSYPAWKAEAVNFHSTSLRVVLVGRVNAPNTLLSSVAGPPRNGDRLTALAHYGVILSGKAA